MSDNYDGFDSWEDVQSQYRMSDPEPEFIFTAFYEYANYSGDSLVVYYDKGKYYLNSGGHCSCYGLEDQWEPEEYDTKELLITCLERNYSRNADLIKRIQNYERFSFKPKSTIEI